MFCCCCDLILLQNECKRMESWGGGGGRDKGETETEAHFAGKLCLERIGSSESSEREEIPAAGALQATVTFCVLYSYIFSLSFPSSLPCLSMGRMNERASVSVCWTVEKEYKSVEVVKKTMTACLHVSHHKCQCIFRSRSGWLWVFTCYIATEARADRGNEMNKRSVRVEKVCAEGHQLSKPMSFSEHTHLLIAFSCTTSTLFASTKLFSFYFSSLSNVLE